MKPDGDLRLADRLALRPTEAAKALGVSERTLRQMLPDLPHLRIGGSVLIPVDALRDWLRQRVLEQGGRAERAAGEVLRAVGNE